MLHLLYGPAASGKTDLLMGRIRTAVAARTPGQVLLVPEQYSHEAERALCAACGDSLSLYAEVLSFTGLARRVAAETGAGEAPLLDQGGRLLCMALALSQTLLEHSGGAWRMQGGGFAGTIQAFVPQRLVQTYHDAMEGVFGKGSCYILHLREQGAVRVI